MKPCTAKTELLRLPNCSFEAVLQRCGSHIKDVNLGEPGVDTCHLSGNSETRWIHTPKANARRMITNQYLIPPRTLQVTIAPTLGSSCVSVSRTTEITGN